MKLTITYPDSWADIKYSQYMNYFKQVRSYEGTDQFERISLEAAAIHFCNVPTELLYSLPEDNLHKVKTHLQTLFSTAPDTPLTNMFQVDETNYGFIPSLDDMTYGEYLDLANYCDTKSMWDNMPIIMSILYRPVNKQLGKQYTIQPYTGTNDDRIELFKHVLTMDVVFGATGFFLALQAELLTGTLTYSMEILKQKGDKQTLAVVEDLLQNGVDITQLAYWRTMILPELTE